MAAESTPATGSPLLALAGVVRRDPATGRTLLDGVSLEIAAGDRIRLSGPSGSGKTVLLRALVLLDALDSGELRHCGAPVADRDVPRFRGRVHYLQQRPTLLPGSVAENLRLPGTLACHRSRGLEPAAVLPWLEVLGRGEAFLDQRSEELSGGERQIVAFLRALLVAPTLLLLDEPTAALDPEAAVGLGRLVSAWFAEAAEERAYVWVRHGSVGNKAGNGELDEEATETRHLRMEAGRLRPETA